MKPQSIRLFKRISPKTVGSVRKATEEELKYGLIKNGKTNL